jgi:hypothetical protein
MFLGTRRMSSATIDVIAVIVVQWVWGFTLVFWSWGKRLSALYALLLLLPVFGIIVVEVVTRRSLGKGLTGLFVRSVIPGARIKVRLVLRALIKYAFIISLFLAPFLSRIEWLVYFLIAASPICLLVTIYLLWTGLKKRGQARYDEWLALEVVLVVPRGFNPLG